MELEFTAEEKAFRDALRAFLTRELTPEVRSTHYDPNEQGTWSPKFIKEFRRKLGTAGYLGIGWPEQYGGGGRSRIFQAILWDELEYHRAPGFDRSMTYIPNALIRFGSHDQKAAFLPKVCRGELTWFVGYSEPEAGSDLANLQARAVADGDDFKITGQKAYSSDAHMADFGWVAARTDPEAQRHRGITLFIVDMKSPGISIAKHPTLAGWTHHSVYFDEVRVPRSMVVGEIGQGWKVVMGAIDFERAAIGSPGLVRSQLDRLLDWSVREGDDGLRPADDPLVADRLAGLAIETEGARLMSYWLATLHSRGEMPEHETSLALLVRRETSRLLDVAAMELFGSFAPLRAGSRHAPLNGEAEVEYRDHLYFQFAAGGFDITRNVIATRGLGLPR